MHKTENEEIEKLEQVDKVEKFERKQGFVYDHKGQPFWCINAMCDHWKISPLLYLTRRRLGLSKKASLTMISASRQRYQDHEGNRFKSFTQMCNFWGQEPHVVRARIRLNWSIEQALEMSPVHKKQCQDHEGRLFESYKDMCKYWKIPYPTWYQRYKTLGLSLKESLTLPKMKRPKHSKYDYDADEQFIMADNFRAKEK